MNLKKERERETAATAKSLQSFPTLCDPIDGSPPGSPVPGILQARTLEWGAISFSNAWKWKVKVKSLSRVRLLATPWTAAYQAPPSMGFSRQKSTGVGCHRLLRRETTVCNYREISSTVIQNRWEIFIYFVEEKAQLLALSTEIVVLLVATNGLFRQCCYRPQTP